MVINQLFIFIFDMAQETVRKTHHFWKYWKALKIGAIGQKQTVHKKIANIITVNTKWYVSFARSHLMWFLHQKKLLRIRIIKSWKISTILARKNYSKLKSDEHKGGGAFVHFHATNTLLWIQATSIDRFLWNVW